MQTALFRSNTDVKQNKLEKQNLKKEKRQMYKCLDRCLEQ